MRDSGGRPLLPPPLRHPGPSHPGYSVRFALRPWDGWNPLPWQRGDLPAHQQCNDSPQVSRAGGLEQPGAPGGRQTAGGSHLQSGGWHKKSVPNFKLLEGREIPSDYCIYPSNHDNSSQIEGSLDNSSHLNGSIYNIVQLSSSVCSKFSDKEQISVETCFDNNQFGYETSQSENVSVCSSLTENNQIFVETVSDINQIDGAVSVCSSLSDNSQCGEDNSESDVSDVSWDNEADSAPIRAVLVPAPAPPGAIVII